MLIKFEHEAQEDLDYFNKRDRKKVKKIFDLLSDIEKNPFQGIGKPEALKHDLKGFWSRRIDEKNRLVYRVDGNAIRILSCRYHYTK